MEIWSNLGGMAPVCGEVGSYFTLGQNSCMLVVSLPLEALHI